MTLSNLFTWNKGETSKVHATACSSACGASDKAEETPSACGAGDK